MEVKADFDIASINYDNTFTFSNIGKAQRNRVFKYLNPLIKKRKKLSILELNCGTGTDAITFGNLGHNVIATDISQEMINTAALKNHSKNVCFKTQNINTITNTSFDEKFDLIFSNFGGLNCLSKIEITSFLRKSSKLLNPKGKLIMVIMPKECLWERLYFSLKNDFSKALRRKTNSYTIANVDGVKVKTWYYNPKDIVYLTKNEFCLEKIKPIGLTIPPSYLEKTFLAKKPFLPIFKAIDGVITNSFFAKYADHFLIELTKK
jgi:2-polyprenyl-3-methyl-5-hydroxy-6-metoxy-1,4-benzoquinol methylase